MIENFNKEELKSENWKDIDGYDGMYQVSDLGRVRSKKSGEWRVFNPGKNKCGYPHVILFKDDERKDFYVHRLVAQAFIPNDDENKTVINHINEVKTDNRAVNLEWCTILYNNTYNGIRRRCRRHRRHNTYKGQNNTICDEIKDLFNPDLSIKENLELFKANGIECSRRSLYRLRKELGLVVPQDTVRDKIKDLYNHNISIYDNLERFKEQGIECSYDTVWRLRKDLGLTKKYKFRNELKDIYDPNLSIKQNIEIFRANGFECSHDTVWRLRKDLGLTRQYRKK